MKMTNRRGLVERRQWWRWVRKRLLEEDDDVNEQHKGGGSSKKGWTTKNTCNKQLHPYKLWFPNDVTFNASTLTRVNRTILVNVYFKLSF
jgi:hypothetical protein